MTHYIVMFGYCIVCCHSFRIFGEYVSLLRFIHLRATKYLKPDSLDWTQNRSEDLPRISGNLLMSTATLPETNSVFAPENRPKRPKAGKSSSTPTSNFQGANLLILLVLGWSWFRETSQVHPFCFHFLKHLWLLKHTVGFLVEIRDQLTRWGW